MRNRYAPSDSQPVHEETDALVIIHSPRSLHAALEAEAEREGVSLNQLVVAKRSMQMSHLVSGGTT